MGGRQSGKSAEYNVENISNPNRPESSGLNILFDPFGKGELKIYDSD